MYRTTLIATLALLFSVPAFAQTTQDFPKHSIGGGARWSFPASSPSLEGTPGFEASYRGWFSPFVGVEVFGGNWRHDTGIDALGTIRTFTEKQSRYSFGANVIGRLPVGRVSFLLGGGPGYFMDVETNRVLLGGELREKTSTRGGFGAQTMMEVDVRMTPALSAFAGFRGEVRDLSNLESSVAYPTAGVRFSF